MSFELIIAAGERRGQRFGFRAREVALGRAEGNDLVLDDASVSRTHARIRARGPFYVLSDGGSTNGTELNGSLLEGSATLRDGDRIGVGAIALEFAARPLPGWRPSARHLAIAGAILAAALCAGLGVRHLRRAPRPAGPACPEVIAVDDSVAGFSFGRGAVDFDCGQEISFGFTAPGKARVRFHYLAPQIAAADEVELKLNGRHLGWAPVSGARGDPQSVTLPDELLNPTGRNVLSAAQARTGKEWSLSGVAIELFARTPGDLEAAHEAYARGLRKLEERKVAPRNLYDAWKSLGQARRALEDLKPQPPLYGEVTLLARNAERDLGRDCARLLFSAERYERYGQGAKAQLVYRGVLLHFPGDEPSGCRRRARQNLVAASEEG
jgi:FHA domain